MSFRQRLAQRLMASRFLRFSLVGTAGFAVDTITFAILHEAAGLNSYAARALSILISMTFSWLGNRNLTFRDHAAHGIANMAREWGRFALANAIGAAANYTTFVLLISFAPAPFDNRYFALAAGTGIGLIFNFTLSSRMAFRTHVAKEP